MTDKPEISIVVVNWNTRDLLRACLKSIYANMDDIAFEVIVVDNASQDDSADMVEQEFPDAVLIRSKENLGFTGGYNTGLRRARGDFLMIVNSDLELLPGSAAGMMDFMKKHPDVGMVGPKLISPDGTVQVNGQRFPTFIREVLGLTRLYRNRFIREWHDMNLGPLRTDFTVDAEVDALAGACLLTTRAVVDAVGLLDERFFMYYEDVDWCLRVKQAGWKVYYLGDVGVIHVASQSAIKYGLPKANAVLFASQYLYWRKHQGLLRAGALRLLSYWLLAMLCVKRNLRKLNRRPRSAQS